MKFILGLIFVLFMAMGAPSAHAGCYGPSVGFDAGVCDASAFLKLDERLNQAYGDLITKLSSTDDAKLRHDEMTWMQRRDALCTIIQAGKTYINFSCASQETSERMVELQAQFPGQEDNSGGEMTAFGTGIHGCAVFGANLPNECQSFPAWTDGTWRPPASVSKVRALVVGAGGGGCSNLSQGMGGAGGGSGKVVTAEILVTHDPIQVNVGTKGSGATQFTQPGTDGGASSFGDVKANGGGGGQPNSGGTASGNGGNNGGGGGGGGNYQAGFSPGNGGAGGSGGTEGDNGLPASDEQNPIQGALGGPGNLFPLLDFQRIGVSAGAGGAGGGASGSSGSGCGGGGGGGGGGILLNGIGVNAQNGSQLPDPQPCGNDVGLSGLGGIGFGAGGGGAGNGGAPPVGGDGAPGVVYIEW